MATRYDIRCRTWHAAYRRWYDHREAEHKHRARAWGRITDTLATLLWPRS